MALANHHDNFDNFNSKYQPWNSVDVGPHKDLIGGWAAAARKNGLRFARERPLPRTRGRGMKSAQGADTNGPLAGVPYDGKLTKADGKGLWWDGLDPQDLYAQNHAPGQKAACGIGIRPRAAACRTRPTWRNFSSARSSFGTITIPTRFISTTPCCRSTASRTKSA